MTLKQIFIKFLKLFFVFVFLALFLAILSFSLFSRSINKSPNYLIETILNSLKSNTYQSKEKINFLILGLDKRDDALEKTTTTDTIIFASLDLKTAQITLISTPRDLWFYDQKIKINNLYPMSLESGQNNFDFLKSNFQKLYGQNIDHIIVVTTDNLISFVDLIGGVDVNLNKGFIDTKYPNPDYIKNPSGGFPIYKTIEFPSGPVHLNQSNVTEFVRSRKGADTAVDGGTDIGRIERQQLLIAAILTKIKSENFINNPNQLKDLYLFWNQQISKTLSDTDILQIFYVLSPNINNLFLNKIEIPIGLTAKDGIIYHPLKLIEKQWVYLPSDDKYQAFQEFISKSIK